MMDVSLEKSGMAAITIDSGAEENVCPVDRAPEYKSRNVAAKRSFMGADGKSIQRHGMKDVVVFSPF